MAPVPVVADYPGFLYAALVAVGGIAGYISKRSKPSLVMGLLFGLIIAVGAYFVSQDAQDVYLSTGVSAILSAVMGSRFFRSRKFMPAGMVSLSSLAMMLRYGYRLFA